MTQFQIKTNHVLQTVCRAMIDSDTWEWPPKCPVFLYQPLRPKIDTHVEKDLNISDVEEKNR